MGSERWVIKNSENNDTLVDMHRYEAEAVRHAIFLNDQYQTDSYYVEKFDKRKSEWYNGLQGSKP